MNKLTPRERQVVALLIGGLSDKEIASQLGTAPNTVRVHLAKVREKTGLHNRVQIAMLAVRAGMPETVAC